MLQGLSGSGDGGAPSQPHGSGGGGGGGGSVSGGFSEEERGIRIEEGERNSGGGNRWPRQETLALLKIRSDMDVAFRDSSLKGPLWDEVSRKLAELGYHRSSKKCKEKFENVYKYHKRTKEGRTSKADGKTYRFFNQLEALEANPGGGGGGGGSSSHLPPPAPSPVAVAPVVTTNSQSVTVPSDVITPFSITTTTTTGSHQNNVSPISVAAPMPTMNHHHMGGFQFQHPNMSGSSDSSSSSTSSDDDEEETKPEKRKSKKRKWKDFFAELMKEVIDKQEELQRKFLERIERRERERMAREEAWRMEEMVKMNREHDLLVQERSMAAAKDAAVITFLQKITEQNPTAVPQMPAIPFLLPQQNQKPPPPPSQPQPQHQQQQPSPPPPPPPSSQNQIQQLTTTVASVPIPVPAPVFEPASGLSLAPVMKNPDNSSGDRGSGGGGGESMLAPSPSRWPKAEINALIKLRTTLDTKYQENAPKGPLWEEISSAMRRLGYNRNAKRCKEKWENINKYYKKVKESSKKRPEDSKTCPYFHQLDAIYKEKANNNPGFSIKPETTTQMAPIMAQPEQQWPLPMTVTPPPPPPPPRNESTGMEDHGSENNEDDYDEDDENYDNEGGQYEIVPNKTSSMAGVE